MTGSYDTILQNILREHTRNKERIIREAFEKHFGFPFHDNLDPQDLEWIHTNDSPISSFRYRGETFLYWEDGNFEFCGNEFKITDRYQAV